MGKRKFIVLCCLCLVCSFLIGCYGRGQLEEDLGSLECELVALKEVSMLEGSIGGNFLGFAGELKGGSGVAFALRIGDGSIITLSEPLAKVRLVYEDVEPYVELKTINFYEDFSGRTRRHFSVGERVELMASEYIIHNRWRRGLSPLGDRGMRRSLLFS